MEHIELKNVVHILLLEDIILNMNAPSMYDDIYYSANDADVINGTYYWFYNENDTIDLNGFTMKMSKQFFIQQRFFMLIELGSNRF